MPCSTNSNWAKSDEPQADGTLVAVPAIDMSDETMASLLAFTDVMSTGYHAAVSAGVEPGDTVAAVVGDGAVGLSGVLSAKMLGAERIIVFGSTHEDRQQLALESGTTDIISVRGDATINALPWRRPSPSPGPERSSAESESTGERSST